MWIKCVDKLPEVDGKYLITKLLLGEPKTSVCRFSKDLYRGVDPYSFYKYRHKRKSGWYEYDDDYGRFYEIDGVIAWQEFPEPYKEAQ